jgi:UTP--glucose-1-phosphate uridylyltransferase
MSRSVARPRKAVFPVGGFGAHFLPATKACPKELLPIVDRPLIQYAVEEAAAAGIRDMIFVTGRNKRAIEDHFDKAYELERELAAREDAEALHALRAAIANGVTFSYVRQPVAAGTGDALLRVRALTGDEPFAVLLPDDLIDGERPALTELIEMHHDTRASVVAVAPAAPLAGRSRARVVVNPEDGAVQRIGPGAGDAEQTVVGRCVLTPGFWPALRLAHAGRVPVALEDGLALLLAQEQVFGCPVQGHVYDCGTKVGYVAAQLAYARKRPDLWPQLRRDLEALFEPPPGPRRTLRGARYVRRGAAAA